MFVLESVFLPLPSAVVGERLRAVFDRSELDDVASSALVAPEPMYLRAGAGPLSKRVRVDRLPDYARDDARVFPVRWSASGPTEHWFPVLDADLEVVPGEDSGTQLRLTGAYRPPFGSVGQTLDRLVLNRIAALTIRTFLTRVADELVADHHEA